MRAYLGHQPGPIVDIDSGKTLGSHRGLWFHTIGQRQGLGLGGGPWFVVGKDIDKKTLLVAHATRLAEHERRDFEIDDVRWVTGHAEPERVTSIKIRHGQNRLIARVAAIPDTERLSVILSNPEAGVAPGQFAVLYDDDECLGSGVIQ